jgi:hypothetical protein
MAQQHINKATYANLREEQLRQLLHWLGVAVELGLSQLRTSVLECLLDCTLKAVQIASTRCTHCGRSVSASASASTELRPFQQVWGKVHTVRAGHQEAGLQAALEAALGGMQAGELRVLLRELMMPAFSRRVA